MSTLPNSNLKISSIVAKEYARILRAPVLPVQKGKEVRITGWPSLTIEQTLDDSFLNKFESGASAIAISQGEIANGLWSIDLDYSELLSELIRLNPEFNSTLISRGERGGNIWLSTQIDPPRSMKIYINIDASLPSWAQEIPETIRKRSGSIPTKIAVGEIRSTGGYTLIHGIHPSGKYYQHNQMLPLRFDPNAIKWPVYIQKSVLDLPLPPLSATLNTCITATLHNNEKNEQRVTEKGTAHARRVLENVVNHRILWQEFERERPALVPLYNEFIATRYIARPGERNAFLVAAIPFLFCAVDPEILVELVMAFYRLNYFMFNDSEDQHRYEATKMLSLVANSYPLKLGGFEKAIYENLPPTEQTVFRICRDLASRSGATGEFFLSANHLARRIGKQDTQAWRILGKFVGLNILEELKRGTRRMKSQRGRATEYRWRLFEIPGT